MKKISLVVVAWLAISSVNSLAQNPANPRDESQSGPVKNSPLPESERGRARLKMSEGNISIDYGRPILNGRNVEAVLSAIKPGGYWVLGSGRATRLDTYVDLKFGDTSVMRGRYLLRAKKISNDKWFLTVNKVKEQQILLLVEVPMSFEIGTESVDVLTINLEGSGDKGRIIVRWGTLTASADFHKADL
jgi:Protein of unknown function (DUF2911)